MEKNYFVLGTLNYAFTTLSRDENCFRIFVLFFDLIGSPNFFLRNGSNGRPNLGASVQSQSGWNEWHQFKNFWIVVVSLSPPVDNKFPNIWNLNAQTNIQKPKPIMLDDNRGPTTRKDLNNSVPITWRTWRPQTATRTMCFSLNLH